MPFEAHTLADGQTVKLGRSKRSPDNPKDLQLPRFLKAPAQLPPPPEVIDNTLKVVQPWRMLGNDRYGDCVFASTGHRRITQAAMVGQTAHVTDAQTLHAYSAATGFKASDPSTDNGAVMVDAANWERRHSLSGDRIFAFARVRLDPRDTDLLNLATYYLGGVWFGVSLPLSAQTQIGGVWDVDSGPRGQPGSWGGHAIWVPNKRPGQRTCITWAAKQDMTDAFVAKYVDEAWAILPKAWHKNDPFEAINWQALDAAIAQFGPVDPAQ